MKLWIMGNWQILVLYLGTLLAFIAAGLWVPRHWLVFACLKAEKALGEKTGQLKLLFVYDLYIGRFKLVSRFLPFKLFSKFVDWVLPAMRKMLENEKIATVINERGAL